MPAYRYVIRGLVQGVGFRFFVLRQATALGLHGYVSNRPDGTVEVVAEGAEPALAELETRLHDGPPSGEVAGVEREVIGPRRQRGFEIR